MSNTIEHVRSAIQTNTRLKMAGVRTKVQNYQIIQDGRSLLQFESEAQVHEKLMKDPEYAAQVAGQSGFKAPEANSSTDAKLDALLASVNTLVEKLTPPTD